MPTVAICYETSCVKQSFVTFDIHAIDAHSSASECPDVKITNEGLTRCCTGCFIAVPMWQQWVSKGQYVM